MSGFTLHADRTSLGVTRTGGELSDVRFSLGDRVIQPMHTAPWVDEKLPADTPPMIATLRGDFFCAPFGSSDVIADMPLVHGLPANGTWNLVRSTPSTLDAELDGKVMGATVTKHVEIRTGETVVYQRHTLTGGNGRVPIGHHAMLRGDMSLELAFAPWTMALTTPEPEETPPLGYPLLRANQTIANLHRAIRTDGSLIDITTFPGPDGFESLWTLVADRSQPLGWTAATNAKEGWVWFGLKDPRVLPQTLIWFSNGGRHYTPWNGRHHAIGLEEICAYFHLGHTISTADNPIATSGSPTAISLDPAVPSSVSYVFGIAAIPPGFGAVASLTPAPGGISLKDAAGLTAFAPCDPGYVTA